MTDPHDGESSNLNTGRNLEDSAESSLPMTEPADTDTSQGESFASENPQADEQAVKQGFLKRPRLSRKAWIATGVGALLLIGFGGTIYKVFLAETPLEKAYVACEGDKPMNKAFPSEEDKAMFDLAGLSDVSKIVEGVLSVEDSGETLIISTKPTDDDKFGISYLTLTCVTDTLEVPKWVTESIANTRAMDGRQEAEWDDFTAQWSYHPDSGANVIIRMN